MLIKDLISKLQELYDTYDEAYKMIAGEPEIMIDVFESDLEFPHSYTYKGFSPNIVIDKSSDGVYDILSTFDETTPAIKDDETKKPVLSPWPFPKSGDPHLKSSQTSEE